MSFAEYRSYDALGLAQLVDKGDVSALELLEIAIARTAAVNPGINCVVEELYDSARSAVRAGLPRGPFTGVPFLLKDLGMMLQGTVTTNGSRFYQDAHADYTSTVVERYQRAGLRLHSNTGSLLWPFWHEAQSWSCSQWSQRAVVHHECDPRDIAQRSR